MRHFLSHKTSSSHKPNRKNGQGMVEFAIVMPILLMVVYGLFEVGRLVFIYSSVITAAREAVRYGSASGTIGSQPQYKNCAGIRAAAQNVDFLGAFQNSDIVITYYDDTGALVDTINGATCPAASSVPTIPTKGRIRVDVTGYFTPVSAIVPLRPFTLKSRGERTILATLFVDQGSVSPGGPSPTATATPPPGGIQPPALRKDFSPPAITVGGKATITFTIDNPNHSQALSGISFSDNYPAGLVNATPLVTTNGCGGSIQASAGGNSINLSGGTLAGYGECSVSVVVTAAATGSYINTTDPIGSDQGGTGNSASATLTVSAAFICNGNKIVHGSIFNSGNTLYMIITNYSGQTLTVNTINVTWNHDKGHQTGGNKTLQLTNIALNGSNDPISSGNSGPAYTYSTPGSWTLPTGNSTLTFTFTQSYDNFDATELIQMTFRSPTECTGFTLDSSFITPPSISKSFSPNQITAGGTSTLTFTISNLNNKTIGLSGVAFSDTFPSGMKRSGTPASLQCNGTVTSSDTFISLSGGTIDPESSCTVTINVTVANAGTYTNTSGAAFSTNGGNGNTASATLVVGLLPPTLNYKSFNPASIQVGGTSKLTLKITNPNAATALTGLAISDTFPTNMTLASTPAITNTCGGTVTSTSGSISLADGTLAGAAYCKVTANVTSMTPGTYTNTSGAVTSSNGGTGITQTAYLYVGAIQPPSIYKSFTPATIQVGATSTLSITIQNPNSYTVLNGIGFTDAFPGGNAGSLTNTCGGGATYASGTITLVTGTLSGGSSCNLSLAITPASIGSFNNTTSAVTSTEGGSGNAATATLTVSSVLPPGINKSFVPGTIQVGQTSSLTFSINNPNSVSKLDGIAFSDTYPAQLVNASPLVAASTCGGTISATAGGSSISFSGGSIDPGGTCLVNVSVTAATAKSYNNTSGTVSSSNGGSGNTASATLSVGAILPPTFSGMGYSSNMVLINTPVTLTFTVYNPNASIALSGITFSDSFQGGMTLASTPAASQCGGTVSSTSTSIALANGTLGAYASCTVSVSVKFDTAGTINNSSGTVTSTNGGPGNTASASLIVNAAVCDATTVTHGSITYPTSTTMQMQINNATGKALTLSQVKVWWNYAYGHYQNNGHPREALSLSQVQLGSVLLIGPSTYPTSPLSISGNVNLLNSGTSNLTVTFSATYDNHEYDAFWMTFSNAECSSFTLTAP